MDLRIKKELGAAVVVVLLSVLVFFAFVTFWDRVSNQPMLAVPLAAAAILWIVVISITLALTQQGAIIALLILSPAAVAAVAGKFTPVALIGAGLMTIFVWLAQRSYLRETNNRLKYRTNDVFGGGLRQLVLGLEVALLSLAVPTLTTSLAASRVQVSEGQIEALLKPAEPFIRDYLPNYTRGTSLNELIDAQLRQAGQGLTEGSEQAAANVALEQGRREARERVAQQLNLTLSGEESVSAVVARVINRSLANLAGESPIIMTVVLIAVVFLTLRALVPFVVWPVLALIAALVWIGRKLDLIYLLRAQVFSEHLQF